MKPKKNKLGIGKKGTSFGMGGQYFIIKFYYFPKGWVLSSYGPLCWGCKDKVHRPYTHNKWR